jgi:high-affinity iron transporter
MAASVGIPGRNQWIATGIAGGVLGAALVAWFAASIAQAFEGNGQELLNASVLVLAVCMLAWHNIWMASHARELAAHASALGRQVAAGTRPLAALALITGAAVLREGSETVLFVYGITASDQGGSAAALLAGGLLGIAGGVAAGTLIYLGLLRMPVRRLFAVTSWMVLLLAGGLAAQAAAFLVQAGLLPALGNQMWDTSFILPDDSLAGRIMHTLVGYVARPEGIQLLIFVGTLVAIGLPMWLISRGRRPGRRVHVAVGR